MVKQARLEAKQQQLAEERERKIRNKADKMARAKEKKAEIEAEYERKRKQQEKANMAKVKFKCGPSACCVTYKHAVSGCLLNSLGYA